MGDSAGRMRRLLRLLCMKARDTMLTTCWDMIRIDCHDGQDPHHDVPCQAQCQGWCSSFTKWESRQPPRPRVNTLGKFLPLPATLSAEERKLTEWAFSLAPSSDQPWHDIKKANRKAWLWVLIFAISFLNCGSLSPLNEKQRCYKSVSQY